MTVLKMILECIGKFTVLLDGLLDYGTTTIGASEGPQLFFNIIEFTFLFVIMLVVSYFLRYYLVERETN